MRGAGRAHEGKAKAENTTELKGPHARVSTHTHSSGKHTQVSLFIVPVLVRHATGLFTVGKRKEGEGRKKKTPSDRHASACNQEEIDCCPTQPRWHRSSSRARREAGIGGGGSRGWGGPRLTEQCLCASMWRHNNRRWALARLAPWPGRRETLRADDSCCGTEGKLEVWRARPRRLFAAEGLTE